MMALAQLFAPLATLARDKADTLLLLAACTLVLAPHAAHLPIWATLGCIALLCWRGWITFRGNRMPPRWLLLPITVLAMAAVYGTHKTFLGRETGVTMLVLLLAFKLLEMHARRDLFVVVFLSFFLLLTNFFYSQSILIGLWMAAAVTLMLTALLSFQYTGIVPPLHRRLRLAALMSGLALPLTLVLFVLFPRIQGPLWGMPGDAGAGRSGLSDSMAPGNIANLALSDEVAFRVRFIDPAPPKSRLYWRGAVLGNYDGRVWTARPNRSARPVILRPYSNPIRHQVTLEASGRRWLFALEVPQAAPDVDGKPARIASDLQLLAQEPVNSRVRYDVASTLDFDLQATEPATEMRDWLTLPPAFNPRTLEFAASLRNESNDNAELVNKMLQFFREQPFRYTLQPPLLGQHAVDEFLFSTRAGFCEHYASAFVVVMRALNIPARVVTGYQGGEINPVDGFMTVRQSDAHAWAEVWLPDRGWIRVDPTAAVAPSRIETNLAGAIPRRALGGLAGLDLGRNSWLANLNFRWNAVNNSWNQWVLNYTPDRQKGLLRSLGFEDADWRTLTALMFAAGAAAMLMIALPLLLHRRKADPVDTLYSAFCRRMAQHGLARQPYEGPQAYAARLGIHLAPEQRAAALHFLQLYEAIRYGPADKASAVALIAKLKSILTQCR
jgi:protein-glutamine gamma-glutamyltransferase